ncbi:phosphatidate cytidylyltransferase [Actibacterium sp. XHP0104]|uniref:phosphatidate cytidylyltransferase n=1 Tax=Actibacterium sp. XHP0104 TaxID=2984335 RepID=UPI0021E95ADF|nr:phosphatidate cytidylyltransferase [Actibacterium sp. XHP0104]MCV2881137.1 phosphatidate cytidylyltransferase [Actibacterium sp. XHP0104]
MSSDRWADLKTRVASGIAMAVIGIGLLWAGGAYFTFLAGIVTLLMIWELVHMTNPDQRTLAVPIGMLGAVSIMVASTMHGFYALPLTIAPALTGATLLKRHRRIFTVYAVAVLLAGYALAMFRDTQGLAWMIWLVLVVVATDVFGYFAGRMLGGPKFWPAISPKKTWSGTVAGWISAAVIGLIFHLLTGAGLGLVLISALLSFASQMGDIAESAIKRRMGVKDSSALIPGHGGVLDRFDGLLGASVVMLIITALGLAPVIGF